MTTSTPAHSPCHGCSRANASLATRDLQLLRYPDTSIIASPVTAGCYLHLYWISRGRMDDHIRWTGSTNYRLRADDRIHTDRTHVYTSFQDYLGYLAADAQGPRDIHSLDYEFPGVVLKIIDAHEGVSREDLDAWLQSDYVPWTQRGPHSPVAMTLRFAPQPLPADKQPDVADIPGVDRRVTLIHLLNEDPRVHWMTRFARHGARGRGRRQRPYRTVRPVHRRSPRHQPLCRRTPRGRLTPPEPVLSAFTGVDT